MEKAAIIFFFALFTHIAHANWAQMPSSSKLLDINNLKFTNRAECARESQRPSKSFFLLIDSLNVGKVLYRLSDRIGKDEAFTVQGVHRFRYTVFTLSKIIASRLLEGKLPLLTTEIVGLTEAQQTCSEGDCRDLNKLIANSWNKSHVSKTGLISQLEAYPSCHAVRKFSPLEAHLNGTKPTIDMFEKIGQAVHKKDELLISCDELFQDEDLKTALYQIDLRKIEETEWLKKGFVFWNSFKLYLSWAFRNSLETRSLSANYANIFRQIDFEESVLIFPNGCRSIVAPECEKDFLNLSSLRMLAQAQGGPELSKLDFFDMLPDAPVDELNESNKPAVNSDILHLNDFENASDWANNFRENLVKTRGFYKLKLSKATSLLNIIHTGLSEVFSQKLLEYITTSESKLSLMDQKEIYLMCSEFKVALSEQTSFLREDLRKLFSDKDLLQSAKIISPKSLEQLDWILNKVAPEMLSVCDSLSSQGFWKDIERPSREHFASWYQEGVFNVKNNSFSLKLADNRFGKPLLTFMKSEGEPICETPSHCARRLVEVLIDLKAFSTFASGLMDFQDGLKSPSLLNPMAERIACRTYDPWFKTKKTISELLNSIMMTAVWSFVPTPIYVDVSLKEKKIISFQEALRDGKVYYDPKFNKQQIQASLIADFGPLLGTPCAVAISNQHTSTFSYLAFQGISLNTCVGGESNTLNVYGPNDIEADQSKISGCFSCTLNLTNIATSALSYGPGIRPFVFLVKGVVRLVQNLKDPHDIPRSWEVDPNQVYRSWRRLGSIYSSCKNNLSQGKECMANKCEANIVSTFENLFKSYVSHADIILGGTSIISVNSKKKYGINVPRFGCSLMKIRKKDFFLLEELE